MVERQQFEVERLPDSQSPNDRSGRGLDDAADLAGPGGFHELERSLKQFKILLVLSHIGAVDLYPFPSAGHTAGLKRDDVAPRELQFGRGGGGQAQSDAATADAGEHLVADEVGIEAADFSCANAREFEKQGVNQCLATGFRCISIQGGSAKVSLNKEIES